MSRNLCESRCQFCEEPVTLEEDPRPITEEDCGVYFEDYEGMLVANAICALCEAKYLAWMDGTSVWGSHKYPKPITRWDCDNEEDWPPRKGYRGRVPDLSFRSTFNDEPGEDDFPKWKIGKHRIAPFNEEH